MAKRDLAQNSGLIVGIGASAGGMEPLQRFLSALPADFNFALVFVQHLSPKHKSLLPELLSAKNPSIAVQEITDGQQALPGRLYLAPPGKEVRLSGGVFHLTVHPEGLIHLPIDEFLISLADDVAERAVGVVFSGAGTDGARGCRAVRNAGGAVYAQDPATAEFASMPLAVISTGLADAALPPGDIAREIRKIAERGAPAALDRVISPQEYDALFRMIFEKTGARFDHYKKSVIERRLRRRIYLHGLSTVKDYLDLVEARDSEAASLASDLMIGVTSFFRDRVAWKALNIEVVRKIVAESSNLPVRVWTPASSTGEEAYSIAMMLSHELSLAGKQRELQVFATDLNNAALERAREGRYPASISADIPAEYVQRYFSSAADGQALVVSKEMRECVVFARQDLLTDPPFSKLDLIICRNFMIYLEPQAQEKCISLFHYALRDGGYLFLGNAETAGRRSKLFKTIGHKQCRVYQKLKTGSTARLPLSAPYAVERAVSLPPRPAAAFERQPVVGLVQEFLLEAFAPAAIAVDHAFDIVYHTGPTNRYLVSPRGVPTQNALELLPETIRNRVRGALFRAGQEGKRVSIRANIPGDGDSDRPVTLRIEKVKDGLFVIAFQEDSGPAVPQEAAPLESERVHETAIRQLENELAATRQDLQSHIEQMKSVNEELQSSNEELQAANEELETSREELQSLNEELVTVNSQLQGKIEEQEETNNDLNNFLASTNIPTLFLDHHLRVRRFTPAMLRLIQLLPSDVGRPIADMSQENLGADLLPEAQTVLEGLVPVRKELLIDGNWYLRAIQPYRTSESRIEGVVITYGDVTELKIAEERTRRLASFPQFNPNPVLEVNAAGVITYSNAATQRALEGLGKNGADCTVFLPHDIDSILKELESGQERSVYREVTIGDRVFGESVYVAPRFNVVRIYVFDITEIRKAEQISGRLAAIVESADDAIISKDLKGTITTWNVGAEKIFGYTAGEAIGKPLSFLAPPGHKDETSEILARIAKGDHIENFETVRMRKDGKIVPVSLTFSPIRDANGRIVGASKIAHDISERKRAESVTRARLRLAAEAYAGYRAARDILRLTLDEIEALTGSKIGFYHFLEEDQETLSLQGWSTNTISSMCTAEGAGSHYNISQAGVWVDCVRERRPVIHNDYSSLPHKKGLPKGHAPVVREMVVPIFRGDRILAVIGVGNKETDYTNADVEIAKLLGDFSWEIVERKRAEAEMQKLAKQRQIALDAARLGWWQYNPITRISEWDDGYKAIFGVSGYSRPNDEILAQIIHPEDLPVLWAKVEAALNPVDPQPYAAEYRIIRPDGAMRWIEAHGIATFEGEGKNRRAVNLVGTVADITDRKRAEEELVGAKEEWERTFESVPDMIAIISTNHTIMRVNSAMAKSLGRTPEECVGLKCYEAVHGSSVPHAFCPHDLTVKDNREHVREIHEKRLGMDLLVTTTPLVDEKGELIGSVHVAHDITERKKAEEELRLSEEKFATAFAANPAAIAMTRLEDGVFLEVTDTWLAMNGYERVEIIGRSARKLPIWPTAEAAARFVRELREKGAIRGWEQEFLRKSGEVFTTQLSAQILTVRGEKVILSTLVDITDRKRAEVALKESEEQFRRSIEEAPIPVIMHAEDGQVLQISSSWTELTGYRLTDLPTLDAWLNSAYGEGADVVRDHVRALFKGDRRSIGLEFPVRTKDGAIRHWSFSASSPGTLRDGRRFVVGMAVDITERKRAEVALKESEHRYHSLFENMIEGFAYCKMLYDDSGQPVDFVYLEVNNAFARLTGLTDVVGKKVTEVIPGIRDTDPELFRIYGRVATLCQPERLEFYVEALRMWFSLSVYCPEKEYFVAVFDVITERKTAEQEIRRSVEELQKANAELERFNRAAVGREKRMIELKKEINELSIKAGGPERYRVDFEG